MVDMVGIGPFLVLPLIITKLEGNFFYAWIFGAILSLVDAMIWSELGAAYPQAGGSYNFLKEAYGKTGLGKMMSFLYVWQTVIQAPLVAASAAIGFSQYLDYIVPMAVWQQKMVSGMLIIFILFLLYRKIDGIGKIGVLLWFGVIATLGWVIVAGLAHGDHSLPFKDMNGGSSGWSFLFFVSVGQASVKAVYSYLGYYNVCHLGSEIRNPQKNIPRSMFISVIGIAVLYMLMNFSVTSVLPWQYIRDLPKAAQDHTFSIFMEHIYTPLYGARAGHTAGVIVTVMILWVAMASLFALMLGYSRVPFAAAEDGSFFKVFAKLHPTKNFPYVSLLVLGGLAFVFSLLFRMGEIISGILAMRIFIQFIAQAVGVVLLRKRNGSKQLPWKMPLYPLPVIVAVGLWILLFLSTELQAIVSFLIIFISGVITFFAQAKYLNRWPFGRE